MEDLLERYKLDAGIAFDIARPRLRAALREYDEREAAEIASSRKKQGLLAKLAREKEKVGESTAAPASTNGTAPEEDVKMEEVKPANEAGTPPPASDNKAVVEAEDLVPTAGDADPASAEEAMDTAANPALPLSVSIFGSRLTSSADSLTLESEQPWHPGLVAPISRIEQLLPAEARSSFGYVTLSRAPVPCVLKRRSFACRAGFFVTFWQLTLYDIMYPKERYDAEINRLKLLQREASAVPVAKADDRRVFVDSVMAIASGLVEEAAKHLTARSTINRRLNREKAHWFSGTLFADALSPKRDLTISFAGVKTKADRARLVDYLLQYCIQPRARMSLPDATFAYQMIKRLHSMNTPHFHTIVLYNQVRLATRSSSAQL